MQDDRDLRARVDRLYVCAKAKRCVHAAADAVRAFDRSIAPIRAHMLMRPANRRLLKVDKVRLAFSKATDYKEFTLVDYLCYPFDCRV